MCIIAKAHACAWAFVWRERLAARRERLSVIDAVVEVERSAKDVHKTPYRDHDEESDDSPEHEALSGLTLLLVVSSSNKVLEHAPDEDDKRDREKKRYRDVVDKTNDALAEVLHVRRIHLCGHKEWERERECCTEITEFLHNV